MTDCHGTVIDNPMRLNQEQLGLDGHFLDLALSIKPNGTFTSEVYQKRDSMPVFKSYRRFPHISSYISEAAKYGVFGSQLHRFATVCSSFTAFKKNTLRLLGEMLRHGYQYGRLQRTLRNFWSNYQLIQKAVHNQTIRRPQALFKLAMKDADKLARHIAMAIATP